MKSQIPQGPRRGRACALMFAVACLAGPARVHAGAPSPAPNEVRVVRGRLDRGGGTIVEAGATSGALQIGVRYEVVGAQEARMEGPGGASFRAMPGAKFLVQESDAAHVAIRLDAGVVADAGSTGGMIDVATPAGTLRGDHATVYARVLPRGVYVEHQATSVGTAGLFSPGVAIVSLAPGTFRMMSLDAGDSAAIASEMGNAMGKAAPVAPVPSSTADVRASSGAAPAALGPTVTRVAPAAGSELPYDPSCGPNPCADPAPVCAPPPCSPPPRCGGCGEYVRTSGVPVPVRADPTGRSPLSSALGSCACSPDPVCACHCGKIPYVHYVEGLECDVTTYRVGNCLVTVRPASRVRVTRLPDGSLQMWAPNIGKDLALIEVGDDQFGYIGDDGFLVIGCDCQFQYFRGLVHLYPSPNTLWPWTNPPRRRDLPGTEDTVQPVSAQIRSAR